MHRIDFIEKAGTGIERIRDEAREQGCPEPISDETGFVTATFRPNPQVRVQAGSPKAGGGPEATGEVVRLLVAMQGEMSRSEMQAALDLRHEDHFIADYLVPALSANLIEMTVSDQPRSSKQRYRITARGAVVLEQRGRKA